MYTVFHTWNQKWYQVIHTLARHFGICSSIYSQLMSWFQKKCQLLTDDLFVWGWGPWLLFLSGLKFCLLVLIVSVYFAFLFSLSFHQSGLFFRHKCARDFSFLDVMHLAQNIMHEHIIYVLIYFQHPTVYKVTNISENFDYASLVSVLSNLVMDNFFMVGRNVMHCWRVQLELVRHCVFYALHQPGEKVWAVSQEVGAQEIVPEGAKILMKNYCVVMEEQVIQEISRVMMKGYHNPALLNIPP